MTVPCPSYVETADSLFAAGGRGGEATVDQWTRWEGNFNCVVDISNKEIVDLTFIKYF